VIDCAYSESGCGQDVIEIDMCHGIYGNILMNGSLIIIVGRVDVTLRFETTALKGNE
jgi:hypothetical protein